VTALPRRRLHEFLSRSANEICNPDSRRRVIASSVDTISTATWLISTLLSWFRLPYVTMTKRLASWFAVSTRWSRKWSAHIDRDELVKRTFAK
jgi:hypothetical protein